MSKFKIINLIDKLFISCAIFLIVYAWINFYVRNLWLTFTMSCIFTFAILYIIFYFINKKNSKISVSKKTEEEINKTFLAFKLSSKNEKLQILNKIINLNQKTFFENGNLFFVKDNLLNQVIIATSYNIINTEILLNIIDENNYEKTNKFIIICNEVETNIKNDILKNKEIEFVTKKILFNDFFSKTNIFPDQTNINYNKMKLNFKDIFNILFTPKKAKTYFMCGLILIFSSIILPYHYYYIIFGSILMLFSVICKLLPKFQA